MLSSFRKAATFVVSTVWSPKMLVLMVVVMISENVGSVKGEVELFKFGTLMGYFWTQSLLPMVRLSVIIPSEQINDIISPLSNPSMGWLTLHPVILYRSLKVLTPSMANLLIFPMFLSFSDVDIPVRLLNVKSSEVDKFPLYKLRIPL